MSALGSQAKVGPARPTSAMPLEAVMGGSIHHVGTGRVEDGRGSLGHSATLRFPSPLIEPDVPFHVPAYSGLRMTRKRPHVLGVVCRVRAVHGFPPHARRSFFERAHGLGILPVSLGPGAHMRDAQGLEGAIDRIVQYREPELLIQPHDQIARPPAHHAMDRSDRALLYDAGEKGLMNSVW